MFASLGVPELLIILVIVLILFGGARLAQVMREAGRGVREFKKGISGEDENEENEKKD
ncbi:MAG: hypothetical protein B1H03_00130 [Planctomycetales bacterium 4484_113]|nr:MAG: hypothetical protein B1H03_00130 [Planctomycetales bacterium 4484_113]